MCALRAGEAGSPTVVVRVRLEVRCEVLIEIVEAILRGYAAVSCDDAPSANEGASMGSHLEVAHIGRYSRNE
jgi:hypothetical protein